MLRINIRDLAFGLFLIAFGAIAYALAGDLKVGTRDAMGPGLCAARAASIIRVRRSHGRRALFAGFQAFPAIGYSARLIVGRLRPSRCCLPLAGLALTGLVVVLVAVFAAHDVRLRE